MSSVELSQVGQDVSLSIDPELFPWGNQTGPQAMATTPVVSDDVAELAAALEHNPRKIYEFVRNHFECEFYYGFLKGTKRTLIERKRV